MVAHPHIGYARQACAQKTSPRRRRQSLSGGAGLLGAEEAPRASTPRTTRPARPAGRSYFRDGLHLRGGQGGGYVLAGTTGTAPNKGAGPLAGLPPGKRERRPEANSQHPKREGQAPRAPETNRAAQQKAHMRAPLRPQRVNQQLQGGQRKTKFFFRVSPLFRRARLPTRRTRLLSRRGDRYGHVTALRSAHKRRKPTGAPTQGSSDVPVGAGNDGNEYLSIIFGSWKMWPENFG